MSHLALPEWRRTADDAARLIRDLDAWAASDELAALMAASGSAMSSTGAARFDELAAA